MVDQTKNVGPNDQLVGWLEMARVRSRAAGTRGLLDPFPKYLQIREILTRRIEREMHIGDQLPTEHALCHEFGVSRETVRDALSGLEVGGLIVRTPGHGTFVARMPPRTRETRLTGLSEDFTRFKLDTEARVLFKGPVHPQANVAEVMGAERDEMLYRIFRLRHLERQPFGLHEAFLPLDVGVRVSRLDLGRNSIVHILRSALQLDIWEDHQQIEAIAADTEVAKLLGIGIGTPVLYMVRHFKIGENEPIVLFRSHYRADRYFYTVALAREVSTPRSKARAAAMELSRVKPRTPRASRHVKLGAKAASGTHRRLAASD
jgi:GntR family transcriptional regulator